MKKRTSCYVSQPNIYDISCDICNGSNITWSEYEGKIWCFDCQKDTDGNGGIFSGPLPINLVKMFGISLDKINLLTGERLYMKMKNNQVTWEINND